ncbi:hypothetical protein ALC53_14281 [Atta colombica]|uniref:Uncharacterized protein n=1 Tax=Atta colombica TaxID=520822 RepID=A0A151HY50_9HYME|nr:hypothetical protein ALC53_14281 [Atta colombica]
MPLIKSFLTPDLNSKLTELPRKNTAPNYRERRANERPEDGGAAPEGLRGKILGDLRIPTREVARLLSSSRPNRFGRKTMLCVWKLPERWEKCIISEGKYFE